MPLLAIRRRLSRTVFKGSLATSPALTKRCSPLATSVTSTAARRAARSAFSACRTSIFTSAYFLDVDTDGAATGQANFPCGFVGHAKFKHLWRAAFDHVHRFSHHGALDAATRYGSKEVTLIVDDQVRADRPRRRSPCLYDGCECNLSPVFAPLLGGLENVFIARKHRN